MHHPPVSIEADATPWEAVREAFEGDDLSSRSPAHFLFQAGKCARSEIVTTIKVCRTPISRAIDLMKRVRRTCHEFGATMHRPRQRCLSRCGAGLPGLFRIL